MVLENEDEHESPDNDDYIPPYKKYNPETIMATLFASAAIRLTIFPTSAPALGLSPLGSAYSKLADELMKE